GLVRVRVGDPAPGDRLSGRLPLSACRPASVPACAAADAGHLAVPLAGLPDHAGGGSDQDPRRRLLARPDLSLLPLRDAADPEPVEPLAAFHAEVVPPRWGPVAPRLRAGGAMAGARSEDSPARGRRAHGHLPDHPDPERQPVVPELS